MEKEIISVIIPAYNASQTITRCINSILNQSFSFFKIYIVDDGSNDNTWEILQVLSKSDDRINILRNKNNMGPSCSRNYALEKCMGEWVCFIDSDDYVDVDFLKNLYYPHEYSDIVIGSFIQVDENENCIRRYIVDDYYTSRDCIDALNKSYGGKDDLEFIYNLCCNKLYRKSLFNNIKFPEGRLQEDAYIMAFLFYNITKSIVAAPNALYYYVSYGNSISHKAQNGERDIYRRLDLVFLYKKHILLHKCNNNLLYKRSRANLLNNIIAIYRLHYVQTVVSHKQVYRSLKKDFIRHYSMALMERNPYLSRKLLLSWVFFIISPSLYLKYI